MGSDDKIVVPESPEPPTADEIRLASLRSAAAAFTWGQMINPTTVKFRVVGFILLTPIDSENNFLRVSDVESFDVQPVPGDPTAYHIRFRSSVRMTGGRDSPLSMMNGLASALPAEAKTETFRLTENGWFSPTIFDRMTEAKGNLLGRGGR